MPLLLRFVLLISIATLVLAGLHYYVYTRVGRHLMLGPEELRVVKYVLIALFVLLWGAIPLSRLLRFPTIRGVMWAAYIWLGSLVVASVAFAGGDLLRLALSLLSRLAPQTVDAERRTLLTRALGVATLGAAGSLIGYALYQGLRKVAVQRLAVTLPKLATELSGFRIVQLTDIHVGPTIDGRWLRRVVEQVNALQPDVIAITGDLVDGPVANLQAQVAPIGELRARHGVYFVTGNHEYYSGVDEWLAELRRLGVRVLRNERVTVRPQPGGGAAIDLVGVDDYHSATFPGHGPDLKKAVAGRDEQVPAVLLAHQPAAISEAAQLGVDLQLSGHTHGGQIWPWGFFVRLQQPYVAGLHRHGATQLYVSCGTGYWGPPMRLLAPAEITEITLRCPA
jgi:predicted MPP superfamily phosphohydrolase